MAMEYLRLVVEQIQLQLINLAQLEPFQKASYQTGVFIKPHFLRTVFTEKCSQAGIEGKYIDAFCGRIPKKVLEANYTVYSPQSLGKQYEKVEDVLTLPFSEDEER